MKIIPFIVIALFSILLVQCEIEKPGCTDFRASNYDVSADYDDGTCEYGNGPVDGICIPDMNGNLAINNQTNEVLYLYKNNAFVTCIPSDSVSFTVNIANPELGICLLQIWKAADVEDKLEPDMNKVYRQWSVALSNTSNENERANWLVTGTDQYGGSGTLLLNYADKDDFGQTVVYQVDIYLNSKNGAKLASLQPGIEGKMVSVDFGVHYLYFHYWYSDPGSSSGEIIDLGWSEMRDIVINEFHKTADIVIPVFTSAVGKFGEVKIINLKNEVVSVYANDQLIENITKVDGSAQGLSNIPALSESTFLIPVNQYTITIKTLGGGSVSVFKGIDVLQDQQVVLFAGVPYKSISVTNTTQETIGLFSQKEEFLGLAIAPGETSTLFLIPESYDTLKFINFSKTKSIELPYSSSLSVIDLGEYDFNRLEFINAWPMDIDSVYESPLINNLDQTVMEATLENSKTITFHFEYNVSSEADYDYFRFTADGFIKIEKVSGETDWVSYDIILSPGNHNLQWIYTKDEMFSVGRDNVRVRNIKID